MILRMLEDDDLITKNEAEIKIAILPPNNANGDVTDEDSGDE